MDVKFKIGDKVRRVSDSQLISHDNEGVVVKVFEHKLIIDGKKVKGVVWNKEFSELAEESSDQCNCDLDILLAKGCQCNGK